VFLDRDGTLIVERGYLSDPDGVELLPGVAAALRQLHAAGVAIVVVSNQAGVGRGLFPVERAWATMARLRRLLRAEGVELDAVRFCPHRPDEGCRCRKPGTGMLEDASEALHLSPVGSVMAGDRWLDAAAGRAAGGMGVLLRTGYGREEEAKIAAGEVPAPDLVLDDLPALAACDPARLESL
jgi:histidinol-phosphate phosphatase family protein